MDATHAASHNEPLNYTILSKNTGCWQKGCAKELRRTVPEHPDSGPHPVTGMLQLSDVAYSPAGGGLIQARHLHVTVSQGFGGAPRSFSQACLHLHRTFISERQTGPGSFCDLTNTGDQSLAWHACRGGSRGTAQVLHVPHMMCFSKRHLVRQQRVSPL